MGRNRQRWGRHATAQPAAASASVFASVPPIAARRWPGRPGAAGSAASRGAKLRGGDSPQGFPLEASEARSAAGAKAWGIEAEWPWRQGRQGRHGAQPESPAAHCADTLADFALPAANTKPQRSFARLTVA